MNPIKKILIVGGGTSGWLTAAYLAKKIKSQIQSDLDICLIESSDIGTIGVGEATIPNIVDTLKELEIDEYEFMKSCSATFKQSIKFVAWNDPNDTQGYYHNFTTPLLAEQFDYAPYWLLEREKLNTPYAKACTFQGQICDENISPKLLEYGPYNSPLTYAYHFDAGQFAKFLTTYSKNLGVNHLIGNVIGTELNDDGSISFLKTKEHGDLHADLVIDCTGFSAHLIEKTMGSEFTPLNDILFVDKAVAVQVPYENEGMPISSATKSTAKENGWIWDIALTNRRGTGYVYSSKYSSKEAAEDVLLEYHGDKVRRENLRHLDIRVGYREKQWIKNCIAIGLSSGFVEPLESTGIYLVEIALRTLVHLFPQSTEFDAISDQYNKLMTSQYVGIVDFIKLHYVLNQRSDTQFWIDNRDPSTCPQSLLDFLERTKNRPPNQFDLPIGPQCFNIYSYFAVMYGMDHYPDLDKTNLPLEHWDKAKIIPEKVKELFNKVKKDFPTHREIIDTINNR